MTQALLPDLPGFSIEHITHTGGVITVLARSCTVSACCPACTQLSSRVHSRSQRTLADLPWSGRIVRLVVQVLRFFCKQQTCPRKTEARSSSCCCRAICTSDYSPQSGVGASWSCS